MSDKIKTLIKMLDDSYRENPHVKTIIFVKDRSVAVYLKKLLAGDESENRDDGQNNEDDH